MNPLFKEVKEYLKTVNTEYKEGWYASMNNESNSKKTNTDYLQGYSDAIAYCNGTKLPN